MPDEAVRCYYKDKVAFDVCLILEVSVEVCLVQLVSAKARSAGAGERLLTGQV